MRLYIVRHGIAAAPGPGVRDAGRALTRRGEARTRALAEALGRLGIRPDRIGTSPLKRNEQTARILAEVLAPKATVERCKFLAPGAGGAADLVKWLGKGKADEAVVVGHMPGVERLASELLCGSPDGMRLLFKKAAACGLAFAGAPKAGEGSLEMLLQPGHVRRLTARGKG